MQFENTVTIPVRSFPFGINYHYVTRRDGSGQKVPMAILSKEAILLGTKFLGLIFLSFMPSVYPIYFA